MADQSPTGVSPVPNGGGGGADMFSDDEHDLDTILEAGTDGQESVLSSEDLATGKVAERAPDARRRLAAFLASEEASNMDPEKREELKEY